MNRRPRPAGRGGFSLAEAVVSIAGTGILLTGLTSALFLALRAADPSLGRQADTALASQALIDLGELQYATQVLARTSRSIEVYVPDRNGNGTEERLLVAWSGVSGAPLRRTYNGTGHDLLTDVRDFGLTAVVQNSRVVAVTVRVRRGAGMSAPLTTEIPIVNMQAINSD